MMVMVSATQSVSYLIHGCAQQAYNLCMCVCVCVDVFIYLYTYTCMFARVPLCVQLCGYQLQLLRIASAYVLSWVRARCACPRMSTVASALHTCLIVAENSIPVPATYTPPSSENHCSAVFVDSIGIIIALSASIHAVIFRSVHLCFMLHFVSSPILIGATNFWLLAWLRHHHYSRMECNATHLTPPPTLIPSHTTTGAERRGRTGSGACTEPEL